MRLHNFVPTCSCCIASGKSLSSVDSDVMNGPQFWLYFVSLLHTTWCVCMHGCTGAGYTEECFTSPQSVLSAAAFTEDPQNATTLLGDQAIFTCSFENINSFPSWVGTDGETYTPSDVDGDVRYIPVSNMTISLNVTATLVRDGVCYRCDANLINNPTRSAQGCLTVVGKWSIHTYAPTAVHICLQL